MRPEGAAAFILTLGSCLLLASCGHDAGWLRGSGTLELDEVDVASLVGGRVSSLRVNEGDRVSTGDTLVVLDRGEVTASLEAQAAQAARAAAQWRDLRTGARPQEVRAARAELAAATAQKQLADADAGRYEALFKSHVASQADLDRARTNRDAADAHQRGAEEQLNLLEAGFRTQQVAAAKGAAQAAAAELLAAKSRVGELVLIAPISGVVLLKNFERGELAQPGLPILTLGNPDSLWMRVYIATPQMAKLRLGAPAEVRVLGEKRAFTGRVVEIATRAEFTPRAALTEEEQANLVFGVKIALDPAGGALHAGLPADARIRAAEERSR